MFARLSNFAPRWRLMTTKAGRRSSFNVTADEVLMSPLKYATLRTKTNREVSCLTKNA